MTAQWETINTPPPAEGRYYSWGSRPGQTITIAVASFDPRGGTDANGNECPQLTGVTVGEAHTWRSTEGTFEKLDGDTDIILNAGQIILKRKLLAANPGPGDLIRITMPGLIGKTKDYEVAIARGAGNGMASSTAPANDDFAPGPGIRPIPNAATAASPWG